MSQEANQVTTAIVHLKVVKAYRRSIMWAGMGNIQRENGQDLKSECWRDYIAKTY